MKIRNTAFALSLVVGTALLAPVCSPVILAAGGLIGPAARQLRERGL